MTSDLIDTYYHDAVHYYENTMDETDYHVCHDTRYRWFLIRQYAIWLIEMETVLRIWE